MPGILLFIKGLCRIRPNISNRFLGFFLKRKSLKISNILYKLRVKLYIPYFPKKPAQFYN